MDSESSTGNTTIPEFDISQPEVAGNASDHIKRRLGDISSAKTRLLSLSNSTFGGAIGLRLKLTELSIISKAEEPNKLEGRAVLEIDVAEDMVNHISGNINGGCSAYLIDITPLTPTWLPGSPSYASATVSQALKIIYHSPAAIGDRLRLVNTTLTMGSRVETVRTEMWNVTHHRFVASGVHVKMPYSRPPKAAL